MASLSININPGLCLGNKNVTQLQITSYRVHHTKNGPSVRIVGGICMSECVFSSNTEPWEVEPLLNEP